MSFDPTIEKLRRRSFLRGIALAGGALALSPLVAACGAPAATPTEAPKPAAAPTEAPKPASAAATEAPKPTEAPNPTAATKPTEAPKPAGDQLAKDQVLRVVLLDEPNGIDPSLAEDTGQATLINQLWCNLVRYKPDLTVEPDCAASWKVSDDAKTYTFTLRDGLKWSDGKPITAKDFEYSFKRIVDPKVASPYAGFVYEIKGAEAYNTAMGTADKPAKPSDADLQKLRDAVGAKAVDDKTFQVDLTDPAVYFLTILPQANLVPLRQDVIEKGGDKWTDPGSIVSNGPFVLDQWVPKSKIVLKKNANYWDKVPTLDRVEITYQTEDATAFAAYQNNEIDLSSTIPDAQIPQIRNDAKLKNEILAGSSLSTYYIGFNVKTKPFDNMKVRQAFQMAIDTKTLCEKVLFGVPKPAKSFIPPGMPGYQPEIGFDFDPAKAKQSLADGGFKDPTTFPKVTLVYGTSSGHKLRMEYIQQQIKQNLGIEIAVENWEPQTYFRKLATDHPAMYRAGWNSDYPHPNDWLNVVWATGSDQNYSQWSNKDYDAMNKKAAAEPDQTKALAMYAQTQKTLVDEAPAAWIYFYGTFRLVKSWVKGFQATSQDPTPGSFFWKNISIMAH